MKREIHIIDPLESQNPTLDEALKLIRQGKPVLAVDAKNKKPIPIVQSWKKYQNQQPAEDLVRLWYEKFPNAGLARICGDGLVVLDVDVKNNYLDQATADKIARIFLQYTLVVRTPSGGYHIYLEESEKASRSFPIKGIGEIRSAGNYVLAPPTRGYDLVSMTSDILLVDNATDYLGDVLNQFGITLDGKRSIPQKVLATPLKQGERNNSLTSIAGSLRHRGADEQLIFETLLAINRTQCNPPLDEEEIRKITRSISNYSHEEWQQPIPLLRFSSPPFPVSAFPNWMREWTIFLAEEVQAPVDMCALMALAVIATACAKKAVIHIASGWSEPLNIFILIVHPPAGRKSIVVFRSLRPIITAEKTLLEQIEPEIQNHQITIEVLEGRLKHIKRKAAQAKNSVERHALEEEAKTLQQELASSEKNNPVRPRIFATDVTPEKLAKLMAEQGGRMSLLDAEGGMFAILSGAYNKTGEPMFDVFLKGHAGDPVRVSRINRPDDIIDNPALTLGLTIQPEVLNGLIHRDQFRGRGLLARFLYAIPPCLIGRRKDTTEVHPMPQDVELTYTENVLSLCNLPIPEDDNVPAIKLSPKAADIFTSFRKQLEPRLGENGDLSSIQDWGGKAAGATARIAANIHMAEHVDSEQPWSVPISEKTIRGAIDITKYLIEHAKAAFAQMGADPATENACYILEKLKAKNIGQITKRDLFQICKGKFSKANELDPALRLLTEHEYVRLNDQSKKGPGRPASPDILVNPVLFSEPKNNYEKSENIEHEAIEEIITQRADRERQLLKNVHEVFGTSQSPNTPREDRL